MTSERKRRARCALCDTTESKEGGWFFWNNRPTVKFCAKCWNLAGNDAAVRGRRWYYLWLR